MSWTYTYNDVKEMDDKIKNNGKNIRALDEFKRSIVPWVGRLSDGAKSNNGIGRMLAALKKVDKYWQGEDAEVFKTKIGELVKNLDQDTDQFVKGMDAEMDAYRELNEFYAKEMKRRMENLRPDQVVVTEFCYATGAFNEK